MSASTSGNLGDVPVIDPSFLVSASTSDCAGKANEKKCTKAGCVWDDVEGSCSDSPTVEVVLAGSAIDEAETLDKPNSGVVTTASAWGIMTAVVMMWFVAH